MSIRVNPSSGNKIAVNPSSGAKIATYDYGSNCVLKGGIEFQNEPTSLVDRSGHGNDGTYANITDAQLSSGLWVWSFNGSSSEITCGNDVSLQLNSGALAFWFKQPNTGLTCPFTADTSSVVVYLGGDVTGGVADESLAFLNDGGGLGMYLCKGTDYYNDGEWHFCVVRCDGSHNTIYIDGEDMFSDITFSAGSETTSGVFLVGSGTFGIIFGSRYGSSLWYDGDIGLPRILKSITTAQQKKMYDLEAHLFA